MTFCMLHTYIGAVVLPTGSFDSALPVVLSDVGCVGMENSLLSCPANTTPGDCPSGKGAAIVCQGNTSVLEQTTVIYSATYSHTCNVYLLLYDALNNYVLDSLCHTWYKKVYCKSLLAICASPAVGRPHVLAILVLRLSMVGVVPCIM